jgi:hypothetical protein
MVSDAQRRQIVIEETVAEAFRAVSQIETGKRLEDQGKVMQADSHKKLNALFEYATAMGFDLQEEASRIEAAAAKRQAVIIDMPPPAPKLKTTAPNPMPRPPTIREFVLAEAQSAYPNPVLAADLRQTYETRYGHSIHHKSIGMTLYRLSQERRAAIKRQGQSDWYFIPEDRRIDKLQAGNNDAELDFEEIPN